MKANPRLFILVTALLACLVMSCKTTEVASKNPDAVSGSITSIEKYGHCVTDVKADDLFNAGYAYGDVLSVVYDNGYSFEAPLVSGYDVDKGEKLVRTEYANGYIAFCINYGKMNKEAAVDVGNKFTVSMKEKGAYLVQYEVRHLVRTDSLADYNNDEVVFANFRAVIPGKLYRGSHPVKTDWARAPYVSKFIEANGVKTLIDMADTKEELDAFFAANPDGTKYAKTIADAGNAVALSMSLSFSDADFGAKLADGIRFMINHPLPAYVHCNEGKDRTGFYNVFVEALLGWKEADIIADYMKTYENYYGAKAGTEKYDAIYVSQGKPILDYIKGQAASLQEGAVNYAKSIGLTDDEIAAVQNLLK